MKEGYKEAKKQRTRQAKEKKRLVKEKKKQAKDEAKAKLYASQRQWKMDHGYIHTVQFWGLSRTQYALSWLVFRRAAWH